LKSAAKLAGLIALGALVAALGAYCALCAHFSNLPWQWLRDATALAIVLAAIAAFVFLRLRNACLAVAALYACVIAWHLLIPASNDRDWLPEYAVLPYASFDGSLVQVRNIRNFDYKSESEFATAYYDKAFDLDKLESVDLILSYWDGNTAVAHTMVSFGFSDGSHLCVSAEMRREKGEPQGSIRGLFKQFEIIMVLGDERDLLRLRTDFRKEELYVFPTKTPKAEAKLLLLAFLKKANELRERPEFYNTLTSNCTLFLVPIFRSVRAPKKAFDMRLILNGSSSQMAYENGWIDSMGLSYEELKAKCHANQYVCKPGDAEGYSEAIRPFSKRLQKPASP